MQCALAIMARTPELNATKTRLQAELGAQVALAAHIRLVESTLQRMAKVQGVAISLWVTQTDNSTGAWQTFGGWPQYRQPDGDLGARMHGILCSLFARGADRVCLIGTDCPDIDAAYIEAAFAALESADVVIGPAEDGGYGLIGMNSPRAALFTDMPWGTADVLAATLARADAEHLRVRQLPVIWDVDTPDDWRRYLDWSEQQLRRGS